MFTVCSTHHLNYLAVYIIKIKEKKKKQSRKYSWVGTQNTMQKYFKLK